MNTVELFLDNLALGYSARGAYSKIGFPETPSVMTISRLDELQQALDMKNKSSHQRECCVGPDSVAA